MASKLPSESTGFAPERQRTAMACGVDRVVQNVPHNKCTKLHDGSDLGHELGVPDTTFPSPRTTPKATSATSIPVGQAPSLRRIGGSPCGVGGLGRCGGEVGDPRTGFAADRASVDIDRAEPAETGSTG